MSSLLILAVSKIFPGFNISQVQNTGFSKLTQHYEFVLAFITLVLIAPFAEELLFRGYLFGKLRKYIPIWTAVVVISMVFGAFHGAWNLAIDTFALSVILCLLRITTDSIWSSIMLHMLKNGIAFYILFIYPTFLSTLVR
jgi:membrane protease YdiL (CAAX protease family)